MVVNFAPTSTNADILRQVFLSVDAQSCPTLFNFHLHTVHSDGKLQPSTLMEQAIAIGLQGLAITDHHSIGGYQAAQDWLETWKWRNSSENSPYLWSGVEINANLLDVEVHILAYAFEPEHPSIKPYLQRKPTTGKEYQANNVIAAIQQAGGLAVLAHPARYKRSLFDLIPAAAERGIDGVETFYAYKNPKPWSPSVLETQQVQQLADEHQLFNTCGTDTHGLSLLQRL
ncbi:PHP domain-containing protein [Nodularia sphaerocarpa]|uniref:PHP domain-containing protein n=1 Tax=Nodularia sphaerocarpa TaxID=137816 RepID=UPI001EFAFEE0|nr:PHP domain-containing protein [Nodularia sphaerocarpa]MDB9374672.1 PHP domain-containing protein [Nodularia sphaerocarpa CS-585]MDB9377757.1 PHP domain-containing protein [Nodularia sphaerocarpa CS-585A2]ULP73080.1 5'-3' exoribonuclease [Nodularia sphaerocarpa UHCC 0038]